MLRIENGWSLLLCVENMAVTVIQQNDGRLTEQEKKIARFAERYYDFVVLKFCNNYHTNIS